jgi:hypothetical protein
MAVLKAKLAKRIRKLSDTNMFRVNRTLPTFLDLAG